MQKTVLYVINADYNEGIIKILKENKEPICYVTVSKGVDALVEMFKNEKLDLKKIFFVDCITKTIITPKEQDNAMFVSSPDALTDISMAITKSYENVSAVLIDSISTLSFYHDNNMLLRFVNNIINKSRIKSKNMYFVVSGKDKDTALSKELSVLVDKVIEI